MCKRREPLLYPLRPNLLFLLSFASQAETETSSPIPIVCWDPGGVLGKTSPWSSPPRLSHPYPPVPFLSLDYNTMCYELVMKVGDSL